MKIRNARGDVGFVVDGTWFPARMIHSTRQGILTEEQRIARAAKKRRYEQNRIEKANMNREMRNRAGRKGN